MQMVSLFYIHLIVQSVFTSWWSVNKKNLLIFTERHYTSTTARKNGIVCSSNQRCDWNFTFLFVATLFSLGSILDLMLWKHCARDLGRLRHKKQLRSNIALKYKLDEMSRGLLKTHGTIKISSGFTLSHTQVLKHSLVLWSLACQLLNCNSTNIPSTSNSPVINVI